MKQIYLVSTGDYEYQVHGVFDTEEKALACANQIEDAYVETYNLNCPQKFRHLIRVHVTKDRKATIDTDNKIGWPIANMEKELWKEEICDPIDFRYYIRPAEFTPVIFRNISEEKAKQMGAHQVSPDNPNYYVKMEKKLNERVVDEVIIYILRDTYDEEKAIQLALEYYDLIMTNNAWGDKEKAIKLITESPSWKE